MVYDKFLGLQSDGMLKFFQFSEDRNIKCVEHFDIALNAVDVEVLADKVLVKFTCDNSTEVYSLYQIFGDQSLDLKPVKSWSLSSKNSTSSNLSQMFYKESAAG